MIETRAKKIRTPEDFLSPFLLSFSATVAIAAAATDLIRTMKVKTNSADREKHFSRGFSVMYYQSTILVERKIVFS